MSYFRLSGERFLCFDVDGLNLRFLQDMQSVASSAWLTRGVCVDSVVGEL
jgi:hypothetical protein